MRWRVVKPERLQELIKLALVEVVGDTVSQASYEQFNDAVRRALDQAFEERVIVKQHLELVP